MSPYAQLSYNAIKLYLTENRLPDINDAPTELLSQKAGCFVTLRTKTGELRGCIGTIVPAYKNLAGEIVANAVAAAQNDPRFKPVTIDELDNLKISVDVLSSPEQIFSEKDLDIKKYGVIVRTQDGREGLLLPDIEGVDSVPQQIAIARQKGGILPDEEAALYRFMAERHK